MAIGWTVAATVASLGLSYAQSVSYSSLSAAPIYADGNFSSPGGATQAYTSGSYLNVTWESDYPSVNLWLIQGDDFASPTGIAVNYYPTWYNWQVDGGTNLSLPFLFRVVNAQGTEEEQKNGGFDSDPFWIGPSGDDTVSTTSSLSSITITSAVAPITSPASLTLSSTSTSTPAATTTTSSATASSTTAGSGGLSTSTKTGLGAGIGIGLGVALIAGAAAFFWMRRYKKKQQQKYQQAQQEPPAGNGGFTDDPRMQQPYNSQPHYGSPAGPQEMWASAPTELQAREAKAPVEVSGWREPTELPGSTGGVYENRPNDGKVTYR